MCESDLCERDLCESDLCEFMRGGIVRLVMSQSFFILTFYCHASITHAMLHFTEWSDKIVIIKTTYVITT